MGVTSYGLVFLVSLVFWPTQGLLANGVDAGNTAVVINEDDPLSIKIGSYYIRKRAIPEQNVIRIRLGAAKDILPAEGFLKSEKDIRRQTADYIQAYALAWSRPYRVGCMSVTSAISLGYDRRFCAQGCKATDESGYYNSASRAPFVDHGIRPSMLIAAETFEDAKQLIDRGINSDYSRPAGEVYLLSTSDKERNVRAENYRSIIDSLGGVLNIRVVNNDWIRSRSKVLAYFTGVTRVQHIESIGFLPGAVADHLTSAGGELYSNRQMSSMKWLEAGATGSYGTVVEPCNFPSKFPHPGVFIQHYLNGDTLLEAYWKSVASPGQGVFIGEPLASPYKGCQLVFSAQSRAQHLVSRSAYLPVVRQAARCNLLEGP